MVNLNHWIRLSEEQYAALMSIYGDEQAMKFALSLEMSRFIEKITNSVTVEHITPGIKGEIA